MARVIALTQIARRKPLEALRLLIVCGCALALIFAKPVFHILWITGY